MISKNLINSVLCCINPRMHVTPTHYVCGCNLALFSSLAQIENCLTGVTTKYKCLTNKPCLPRTDSRKK